MSRFLLAALALATSIHASAVELPGELVPAASVSTATAAQAPVDHRAAWEAYLREQRAQRLADLQRYAAAGRFPQKDGEPGWHHQFLDAQDVPCAVASLIWTSGHEELVRQTAATHNDVVVSELDGGPIVAWVAASGLTMEEIAIIQEPGWEPDVGFTGGIEPLPEPPIAQLEAREVERLQAHLAAVQTLLAVDTDSSIHKALDRLGDRVHEPPPGRVASLHAAL